MNRIFTTLFVSLLFCFQWMQADVTVTFNVNMNHVVVNPSGVYVAGGNIGNPGDNELTDPDGDGIYSGSIVVADNFFSFYTILNGNCGDYSCKERIAGQACSDPANFNDRQFQAGTTDMSINTCFGVCSDVTGCAMVNVEFSVNMENETVDPGGVFLAGGIGFGQPGDIPMTDPDNDNKYTVTRMMPTDYFDNYTFTNGLCPGNFACKEQLGGQPCADPNFFNDRQITIGANDMNINTCFGECSTDGVCSLETFDVTFQVDMSGQDTNPGGVFMGANFDGWSGGLALSDPDGDDIWSITVDLAPGAYEYKFINGPNWVDGGEFVPVDCDVTGGAFQNRGVTVINQDQVLPVVCFASCTPECPVFVDVTFRVDMSKQDTNPGGIFMGANFDSWSGGLALADPDGDDVWEVTVTLPPGSYEYKYINGPNWCCPEGVPAACDVTVGIPGGPFQNRGFTVSDDASEDIILDAVCFGSCVSCDEFVDVTFTVDMALEVPNPGGIFMGSNIDGWSGNIAMTQLPGTTKWFVTMCLAPGAYEYKFINGPGWCCAESVPLACDVTVNIPGGPYENRGVEVPTGSKSIVLDPVCFGSCDKCPQVGCMDPNSHNYNPRAEVDPSQKTFYWDDVDFIDSQSVSNYCGTQVYHFENPAEVPSSVFLTISNVDANTMEVIVESADADPVDFLLINGGSGAAISGEDFSVPGQIKRTLTWAAGTAPADVTMNILWSKQSFGGNWQLIPPGMGDLTVPFAAGCEDAPMLVGDLPLTFDDPAIDYNLVDFGGAFSAIVVDPTDPANMVVETTKASVGSEPWELAQTWAGTVAGDAGLTNPIPFTATSTKMSVRVWSPEAGIPVLLKVEQTGAPWINSEVEVNTSMAGEWETMVFDFAGIDLNNVYDKVVIFFDFGTAYPASICETCNDGELNGDEVAFIPSGGECGGSKCVPCAVGCTDANAHNFDPAAAGDDGSCETCNDGILNGDEEDVDCGGALCAPCNDMCMDADEVECGETVFGDSSNATDDDPGLDCGDVIGPAEGVWYVFEGNGDDVTISTDHIGTDGTDTNIQVFDGSCGALNCVAGDEDGGVVYTSGWTSMLTFNAVDGVDYYIHISGYSGDVGPFEMTIDCASPLAITEVLILGVPVGAGTGAIEITVEGGCEPYSYEWSGPSGFTSTAENLTGLTVAGTYDVTVTDCNNETVTDSYDVPTRGRGGRGRKVSFVEDAVFNANPNPFNQETTVTFNLPVSEEVSLEVFDVAGKKVSTLFNGTAEADTNYQLKFGGDLPTGTYIATLTTTSGEVRHIKLILAN